MYAIVEFKATQEVELVPCTWICGNTCLWPKVTTDKAKNMVRKGEPPGSGFSEYDVNVKGLFGKYCIYFCAPPTLADCRPGSSDSWPCYRKCVSPLF